MGKLNYSCVRIRGFAIRILLFVSLVLFALIRNSCRVWDFLTS